MLCDECGKRNASYHMVKKMNGETIERHLCSECQKKYGVNLQMHSFGNLFEGFSGLFDEPRVVRREEYVCPSCGTTGDDFLRSGFVGCSDCYKEFAPIMMPVIRRLQGDVSHTGKVPMGVENSVSAEYDRLKKELEKALELEEYEQATIIRDRMRQLKGE